MSHNREEFLSEDMKSGLEASLESILSEQRRAILEQGQKLSQQDRRILEQSRRLSEQAQTLLEQRLKLSKQDENILAQARGLTEKSEKLEEHYQKILQQDQEMKRLKELPSTHLKLYAITFCGLLVVIFSIGIQMRTLDQKMQRLKVLQASLETKLSDQSTKISDGGQKILEQGKKLSKQDKELRDQGKKLLEQSQNISQQDQEIQKLKVLQASLESKVSDQGKKLSDGSQKIFEQGKELFNQDKELRDQSQKISQQDQEKQKLKDSLAELKKGLIRNVGVKESLCYAGLKNREIPDSAFKATSRTDDEYVERLARLDNQVSGGFVGAWCSQPSLHEQWIQVDLGRSTLVAGVITQGRPKDFNMHVTSYKVACGEDDQDLKTIQEENKDKIFIGNTDRDTKVPNKFPEVMSCRFIRIYPQTWKQHMCMRLEIIRGICFDAY